MCAVLRWCMNIQCKIRLATADLSNRPAIIGASGFSNRVELRVLRPDTLANAAALTYEVIMAGLLKTHNWGSALLLAPQPT